MRATAVVTVGERVLTTFYRRVLRQVDIEKIGINSINSTNRGTGTSIGCRLDLLFGPGTYLVVIAVDWLENRAAWCSYYDSFRQYNPSFADEALAARVRRNGAHIGQHGPEHHIWQVQKWHA